jgi:hypothetical protein
MKIKEYGYIKPREIKCNHCGAILEYVNYDVNMTRKCNCYIRCKVCGKLIYKNDDGSKIKIKENGND